MNNNSIYIPEDIESILNDKDMNIELDEYYSHSGWWIHAVE